MSTTVWLVHWTGRSVIVCVRSWAIAARVFGGRSDLRLYPIQAWSLMDGVMSDRALAEINDRDAREAMAAAAERLQAFGRRSGANIRDFGPATIAYDPYRASEHWLGQPAELRDRLCDMTMAGE